MDINLDLQTSNGAPAQALAAIIEARRRELGETTMQSCIAMAEGILRSLRAQTKIANESKNVKLSVNDVSGQYVAGWKREGAKSKRVLRLGEHGSTVQSDKVIWKVGKYVKGEVVHVFKVVDSTADPKIDKYLLVTTDEKTAKDYAMERHKKLVLRYKGLARTAISLAMKAVYNKGAALDNVSNEAAQTAKEVTQVRVNDTGFNSGTASVYVHDGLNYAVAALKDGESSVSQAVNAALRKTMGYIMQKVKSTGGSIDKSLKTTVDELIGAQK